MPTWSTKKKINWKKEINHTHTQSIFIQSKIEFTCAEKAERNKRKIEDTAPMLNSKERFKLVLI